MSVHYYSNLILDGVSVREQAKPETPKFADYGQYRQFLSEQLKAIAANASAPARKRQFEPIVFSSNGYDSTVCAVLGLEIGCNEAVAFESKNLSRSDSGAEIVSMLGYEKVHKKEERDYLSMSGAEEFLGTGELGTSIFFAAARPLLRGRMLLSGVHGGNMWSRHHREDQPQILRSSYPDTALTEFRLATGYVRVPPAFLTAMSQANLHDISNSAEMKPWTLGVDYDRPIPRRIAEEAGVPRAAFGMVKEGGAGTSLRFGNLQRLRSTLPLESYRRFAAALPELRRRRRFQPAWLPRASAHCVYATVVVLSKRNINWPHRLLRVDRWSPRWTASPFAPSFLFLWAVSELQNRNYRGAQPRSVADQVDNARLDRGLLPSGGDGLKPNL